MNEETKQELVAKYRDSYRDYLDDYLDKVKNEGLEVSFSVWVCMRLKDSYERNSELYDLLENIHVLSGQR